MAQHDFKIGDVERLKSGSPAMVANFVRDDASPKMMWFANDALHDAWAFPVVMKPCKERGGPFIRLPLK